MQVSKEGIERIKAANELGAVLTERGVELRKKGRCSWKLASARQASRPQAAPRRVGAQPRP